MCETSRDPKLSTVIFVELNRNMPSESRTAYPNINRDIENAPAQDGHELSLCLRILKMEATQHAECRSRKIILHERAIYAHFSVTLGLECFEKETSRVPKHLWFNDHDIRDFSSNDLH